MCMTPRRRGHEAMKMRVRWESVGLSAFFGLLMFIGMTSGAEGPDSIVLEVRFQRQSELLAVAIEEVQMRFKHFPEVLFDIDTSGAVTTPQTMTLLKRNQGSVVESKTLQWTISRDIVEYATDLLLSALLEMRGEKSLPWSTDAVVHASYLGDLATLKLFMPPDASPGPFADAIEGRSSLLDETPLSAALKGWKNSVVVPGQILHRDHNAALAHILRFGASPNADIEDNGSRSAAVLFAGRSGNHVGVDLLLKNGANANAVTRGGRNLMYHAMFRSWFELKVNLSKYLLSMRSSTYEEPHVFENVQITTPLKVLKFSKRFFTILDSKHGGTDGQSIEMILYEIAAKMALVLQRHGVIAKHINERIPTRGVATESYIGTPLMHAAYLGSAQLCQDLLSWGANVNDKNAHGMTALHYAAALGWEAVYSVLLSHGADIHIKDMKGRTADDLIPTPNRRVILADSVAGSVEAGWDVPESPKPYECNIDVKMGISQDDFFRNYVIPSRPVLLRGAAKQWKASGTWTRGFFEHGPVSQHNITVYAIPFGEPWGFESKSLLMEDFVKNMGHIDLAVAVAKTASLSQSQRVAPAYWFDSQAAHRSPQLLEDVSIPPPVRGMISSSVEVFLGPAGSGAPFHYHNDAWNAVMHGTKRWFMLPPGYGHYSTVHPSIWLSRQKPHPGKLFECVQQAGDIMYVPQLWSHSVINLSDSVGIAHEFQ